jgi:hypothetical protein
MAEVPIPITVLRPRPKHANVLRLVPAPEKPAWKRVYARTEQARAARAKIRPGVVR